MTGLTERLVGLATGLATGIAVGLATTPTGVAAGTGLAGLTLPEGTEAGFFLATALVEGGAIGNAVVLRTPGLIGTGCAAAAAVDDTEAVVGTGGIKIAGKPAGIPTGAIELELDSGIASTSHEGDNNVTLVR